MAKDKYYIDETFDIDNCQNYILSIRCSLDGFSFCIYDTIVKKFIVMGRHELNTITPFQLNNELEEIVGNEPILKANYKKVIISFLNRGYIEVPEIVYNKGHRKILFEKTRGKSIDESILDYKIGDKVCLFSIPKTIHNFFLDQYINSVFIPELISLSKYANKLKSKESNVLVCQEGKTAYILVFEHDKTAYQNSFEVHTLDDLLFYVLNVYKKLELSSSTPLHLVGTFNDLNAVQTNFKKFLSKIETASYRPGYSVSYTFRSEAALNHIPLIEQVL